MSLAGPLASPLSGPLSGPLAGLDNVFNPISLSLLYFDTLGGSMLDSGGAAASHGDTVAVLDDLAESTVSLVLPGTSGNYASVPDEAALDITGDFRIEIDLQDSPTPTTDSVLFSKWTDSGNMRAIRFQWNSTGALRLDISTDGTFDAGNTVVSSVVVSERWVALAWESSTGTTTFYQSPDGANWSQLGVTGTTTDLSVYNTAANVNVGSANAGTLGNFLGSVGQVRFFASTDGTDKRLDIDFTTPAAGSTSFTASTGQTVTINQSGDYPARIGGTSYAAQSTDSLRPVALTERGLYIPKVNGNSADIATPGGMLGLLGDFSIEVIANFSQVDHTSSSYFMGSSANGGAFQIRLLTSNTVRVYRDISGGPILTSSDSWATCDGVRLGIDVDGNCTLYELRNGAWSLSDSGSWSLGGAADSTDDIRVGALTSQTGGPYAIQSVRVWDGVADFSGDPDYDVDFTDASVAHGASSFVCSTGQTVTIKKSGDDPATLIRYPVARFDGSDDYLSGTFGSTLTGGWMFAVFEVLGSGGENFGRVLSCAEATGADNDADGCRWSMTGSGGELISITSINTNMTHTGGFSGRVIHDALQSNGAQNSTRNGADEKTATDTVSMSLDRFSIGGRASDGTLNPAIDLHHLSLYPASLTAAEATKVRNYLNNRYNIY